MRFQFLILKISVVFLWVFGSYLCSAQCDGMIDTDNPFPAVESNRVFLDSLYSLRRCIQSEEEAFNFYLRNTTYAINNWKNANTLDDYVLLFADLCDTVAKYYPNRMDTSRVLIDIYSNLFLQRKYQDFGYYEKSNILVDSIRQWLDLIEGQPYYKKILRLSTGIEKAKYLKKTNQYKAAIEHYVELIDLVKEQSDWLLPAGRIAKFNLYIAQCYQELNVVDHARSFYKQALSTLMDPEKLLPHNHKEQYEAQRSILLNFADFEMHQGNIDQAKDYLIESESVPGWGLGDSLTFLRVGANLSLANRDTANALNLLSKNVKLGWKPSQIYSDEQIKGLIQWEHLQGNMRNEEAYQRVISGFVLPKLEKIEERKDGQFALSELADLYRIGGLYYLDKSFNSEDAIDDLETSILYLDKGIRYQDELQTRFSFEYDLIEDLNDRYEIYSSAILANFILDSLKIKDAKARIFDLIENSKSRVLADAVEEKSNLFSSTLPDSVMSQMSILRGLIMAFEKDFPQIFQMSNEQAKVEHNEYWNLKARYQEILNNIENKEARRANAGFHIGGIGLDELQNSIGEQTSFLSFIRAHDRIIIMHISRDNVDLKAVNNFHILEKEINNVQAIIQKPIWTKNEKEKYINSASAIYQTLIGQFNFDLKKEICISPDPTLAEIPFSALITMPCDANTRMDKIPFAVKSFDIYYNYSINLWRQLKNRTSKKADFNVCAFAPNFDGRKKYASLKYNIPEAEAVTDILAGKAFLEKEATKENFIEYCRRCAIIHLSTHGESFGNPNDYLTFQKEDDFEQLKLGEIYNQTFITDLIVLSACETGIGDTKKGEGVISLARGFLYAGVNSVLTTLWQISDQGSYAFNQVFYDMLSKGNSIHRANSLTQQYLLNETQYSTPYYWAAFVPIGHTNHELSVRWPWSTILFFSFIPLLIIGIIIWKKRNI